MEHDDIVRARINSDVKAEANAVLKSIGLDASTAFRMMMMRIAREKALPFDPLIPNEDTINAMREARGGKLKRFESIDSLMQDLCAGD